MDLFQKVNHPKFLEKLDTTKLYKDQSENIVLAGPYIPTQAERTWLKEVLNDPGTNDFLSPTTMSKLQEILQTEGIASKEQTLIRKGKPSVEYYPVPLLKQLRELILEGYGMTISYNTKNGDQFVEEGIPFKLEFNISKKKWLLWWFRLGDMPEAEQRRISIVEKIVDVKGNPTLMAMDYEDELQALLPSEETKQRAILTLTPKYERMDLQRFFNAFSSFEKEISLEDSYQLTIHYYPDEEAYLLSKIRAFGPHIKIEEPASLRAKMVETAVEALKNYELHK